MAAAKRKYGYNAEPRISANQLADYLNAAAPQRKRIIRQAKFPPTVIVARYEGARDAITSYLCDRARDGRRLASAIETLQKKEAGHASTWVKEDCRSSAEAIGLFQRSYNKTALPKLDCRGVQIDRPKIVVEGVRVSVALNATVHRKNSDGEPVVGGLILLFSKAEASQTARNERAKTAAVLSYLFTERQLKALGTAEKKICLSYDVFGGDVQHAPTSSLRRIDGIQTSCEEIALWWDRIEPPEDYDGPPVG